MNEFLHTQTVFASIRCAATMRDPTENYADNMKHVLSRIERLRDNQAMLDYIHQKTNFNIAGSLTELKKTHLVLDTNFTNHDHITYGWSYTNHHRYAVLNLGQQMLNSKSDSKIVTTIGHEIGHVASMFQACKPALDAFDRLSLDDAESEPSTHPYTRYTSWVLSKYDESSSDRVQKNWLSETNADLFAAAVDPYAANIGDVYPYGWINKMFQFGLLPLSVAHYLGDLCEKRNRTLLGWHEPSSSRDMHDPGYLFGLNINGIFGLGLSETHPPMISRSVKDAEHRKMLKTFEKQPF